MRRRVGMPLLRYGRLWLRGVGVRACPDPHACACGAVLYGCVARVATSAALSARV